MTGPIAIFSLLFLLMLFLAYRWSGGLFSVSFLIMLYLGVLYLGAIDFYLTEHHYTFVFVFFMALFYLIGVRLAGIPLSCRKRHPRAEHLSLYNPVNTSVLKLSILCVIALNVTVIIYRLQKFGVPLLAGSWYTVGIESLTGIPNRFLASFGHNSLMIITLICYGLYKLSNNADFKCLSILSFSLYVAYQVLQGWKSAAIMPFVLILMAMFYATRKIPRRILAGTSLMILLVAVFIGSVWSRGFDPKAIFELFYKRITYYAALHLDFLFYDCPEKYQYQLGGTVLLELKRFVAQTGFFEKEPLFKEIIGNLRAGYPLGRVTGVAPELSLFGGLGYANFGIVGAIMTALILGYVVQRINIALLSRKTMNVFSFAISIYFVFKLLGLVRGGEVLISIEKFLIEVIPPLGIVAIGYLFWGLPFPSILKWRRSGLPDVRMESTCAS